MTRVRTTYDADLQAVAIDRWWREHRSAAAGLFQSELAEAFERLASAPMSAPAYSRAGLPEVRRLLMPRTRFHLYYRVDSERDEVVILAVWSAVRGRVPGAADLSGEKVAIYARSSRAPMQARF